MKPANLLSLTGDDLVRALQPFAQPSVDEILDGAEVRRMVEQPWRINEVVTGSKIWPPAEPYHTARRLHILAREKLEMSKAARGKWWHSMNKHITLQQAARALEIIIGRNEL